MPQGLFAADRKHAHRRPSCAKRSTPWRRYAATLRAPPNGRRGARRLCQTCSCFRISDNAHFHDKIDAVRDSHRISDVLYQILDVGGAAPAFLIDDEIGMLFRHARTADGVAL